MFCIILFTFLFYFLCIFLICIILLTISQENVLIFLDSTVDDIRSALRVQPTNARRQRKIVSLYLTCNSGLDAINLTK